MRDTSCRLCNLYTSAHHNVCVWGTGRLGGLMLIGEAPGREEDLAGAPFVGQAGKLLNHILTHLSIKREDVYITNVLKCRPFNNELPKAKELKVCVDRCWPYLQEEIETIDPKAIVLLGSTALEVVAGLHPISIYEGMEIPSVYEGARMWAAYHPAFVLRQPRNEVRLAQTIKRAAEHARFRVAPVGGDIYDYDIFD